MDTFHVNVGDRATFSKTVGETDVYLFAGITGDFSGNHVNEEHMRRSTYGTRIAHGALLIGFMSTTSTMICARAIERGLDETPVSLGYDHVRFLKGVRIGDTITVSYTIAETDAQNRRSQSKIEVTNQKGELVAVAEHILRWVKNT